MTRPPDLAALVDRLAALTPLAHVPHAELEWLVDHGQYEVYEAGFVLAPKGKRIDKLWVILSGHMAVRVDRGGGPRRIMGWRAGEVSGMLPYSRMTGPPGDNYIEERTELLTVHEKHFPEMTARCPVFTAHTVHLMLDRARSFNTSDLQDEKMISLGKLAAGLAHELNNPASAAVRGAKLLIDALADADAAARALGSAGLTAEQLQAIEEIRSACLAHPTGDILSPLQQAEREDRIADWLVDHDLDEEHAEPLADTAVTIEGLDQLARVAPSRALDPALRWIAAGCTTAALASDIERATARIHDLVAAVKRFTYMDRAPGPDLVPVEDGLRDTLRVVAGKARAKGVAITLDVPDDLPPVLASGAELNQVWLNLVDNALDAIPDSGHIDISARAERDRVVVRVTDDGPGIPAEIRDRIFDPFFTTKPPGEGTGLGLEITRRVLRRYRGDVSLDTRPGHTEFRVSLPAAPSTQLAGS